MHQATKVDIHILGSGAIGCLWAHHLTRTHNKVAFVSRHAKQQSMSFVLETNGEHYHESIPVLNVEQSKSVSILLVCVKAYQLERALNDIKECINPHSRVILLQNGMGNMEIAQSILPNVHLLLATNTHGAFRQSPQHIIYTGKGQTVIGPAYFQPTLASDLERTSNPLAAPSEKPLPQTTERMIKTLNTALAPVTWQPNIQLALWKKLVINAVINPLTAYYNCQNGQLQSTPEYYQKVAQLITELQPVIQHHCPLLTRQAIEQEVDRVIEATSTNFSSMHQDYHLGRKTEIEAITGYLLQCAAGISITMPAHETLFNHIQNNDKS